MKKLIDKTEEYNIYVDTRTGMRIVEKRCCCNTRTIRKQQENESIKYVKKTLDIFTKKR